MNLGQGGTPRFAIIKISHIKPRIGVARHTPLINLRFRVAVSSELIPHKANNPEEINPCLTSIINQNKKDP